MGGQASMFDHDIWPGKTSPVPSQAPVVPEREMTSAPSSKKRSGSPTRPPMFLDLRKASGQLADASWQTDGQSLGAYSTHSFGECPSAAVESHLWQILQANPHQKYYLSEKAKQGILRRAQRREKKLPELLMMALTQTDA